MMDPATLVIKTTPSRPEAPSFPLRILKKNMSISQAYRLAHVARARLSGEAKKADHSLRLLVGHANLLDSLMMDLAEAEREQQAWFNKSAQLATKKDQTTGRVQWVDRTVVEEPRADWQAEDAGASDSDEYDDDVFEDDDENLAELALQRSPSRNSAPPTPELDLDEEDPSDSSSDDDTPPSPPNMKLPTFAGRQTYPKQEKVDRNAFYDDGFYLPPRDHVVDLISVY